MIAWVALAVLISMGFLMVGAIKASEDSPNLSLTVGWLASSIWFLLLAIIIAILSP
jgi:arginine exporter protein ArgO